MSRGIDLRHRCDNIRKQFEHFRTTGQPEWYQETLEQLRILIRFTRNRRERAAYQKLLDEFARRNNS